uniref:Transmembrane protein TauE like protein n=1 Tax=Nannochloropsis gaditana (strain CCMP526) TaxID=1093141 RepID=I2CPE9_NANGC
MSMRAQEARELAEKAAIFGFEEGWREGGREGGREASAEEEHALASLLATDRRIPLFKPLLLSFCFLGIVVINLVKGGSKSSLLAVECGSGMYWFVTLLTLPWAGAFFLYIRRLILKEQEAKVLAHYPFVEGDIRWTPTSTLKFPLLCVMAGVLAGVFGVGGGIVKGPLMLEMGVLPPVAAASAATMILYTSASATVAFYVFGLIPGDYGLFFFFWGFLCTGVGQILLLRLLQHSHKQSLIVLSIGLVITLSAVMMSFQAVADYLENPDNVLRMSTLCG